jgi:aminoacylase
MSLLLISIFISNTNITTFIYLCLIETSNSNSSTTWEFINDGKMEHALTSIDPTINKWYALFQDTLLNKCQVKINPSVFPAATDSRFLRACGVRAFGFSPMRNSPILLHEHDEYLDEHVFIEGCEVYIKLLRELSSQEEL